MQLALKRGRCRVPCTCSSAMHHSRQMHLTVVKLASAVKLASVKCICNASHSRQARKRRQRRELRSDKRDSVPSSAGQH